MKKTHVFFAIVLLISSVFAQEQKNQGAAEEKSAQPDAEQIQVSAENKQEIKKPEYQNILDSSAHLHLFTYTAQDTEALKINQSALKKGRVLTSYSKNIVKRSFYDSNFYLEHTEIWNCTDKASEAKMTLISYYSFSAQQEKSSVNKFNFARKVLEYNLVNKMMNEFFYDEDNNLIEKNEYCFPEADENTVIYKKNSNAHSRLEYTYRYKYDDMKRVLEEEVIHIQYSELLPFSKQKQSVRKNVYEYQRVDVPPVTTFYEDGVLRMKTIYTTEKEYVQSVFFDNDASVRVEYRNGKKYSEIFYFGNKERQKKIYE